MYLVGKIINTHGIKGEVKVKSETNFDRFQIGNKLYIEKNAKLVEIIINSHRLHKGFDLITFNNLNNINDVLEYVNCNIYTEHSFEELNEGEYYYEQLIGLSVFDESQQLLGVIKDIREVPQGIILEVSGKKDFLVPFVEEFIINVDLENKKITINVIEGLI